MGEILISLADYITTFGLRFQAFAIDSKSFLRSSNYIERFWLLPIFKSKKYKKKMRSWARIGRRIFADVKPALRPVLH